MASLLPTGFTSPAHARRQSACHRRAVSGSAARVARPAGRPAPHTIARAAVSEAAAKNGSLNGDKRAAEQGGGGDDGQSVVLPRLDDIAAKYHLLDDRLDAVERALVEIYKKAGSKEVKRAARTGPQGAAGVDGAGQRTAAGRGGERGGVGESGGESEADGEAQIGGVGFDISKLQSNVVETLNSGHLESIKTLREDLLAHEWELNIKRLAMHRGVANFEHYCASNKVDVDYDVITRLYENPTDLSVITDARLKLMARSMIEQVVVERYSELYKECTQTAKELAEMSLAKKLPLPGGSAVSGGLAGVVKSLAGGFFKK